MSDSHHHQSTQPQQQQGSFNRPVHHFHPEDHHQEDSSSMSDSGDAKVAKLQAATDKALFDLVQCQQNLQESENAVQVVKGLLRELDEEEQQRVKVADTKLPELLALLVAAKDSHVTATKRYETNQRYLELYKQKAAC
eukprot:CAMPEP_0119014352 /NCGR_PEP_ID=MMETSP1176-20130426/9552_1 /TAXON_ID=265551 /ORGANISM="Synedropsis recta cf, Strain CCMP1620" /LENGTH=137 /DNA_ID=CAMNT_0006967509 /DNA_START=41 /DNA_END=454 /DNA_ORIENTATION=+